MLVRSKLSLFVSMIRVGSSDPCRQRGIHCRAGAHFDLLTRTRSFETHSTETSAHLARAAPGADVGSILFMQSNANKMNAKLLTIEVGPILSL